MCRSHDVTGFSAPTGMLQTLDARLAQAPAGELGQLEFLQVLCHDEISRREIPWGWPARSQSPAAVSDPGRTPRRTARDAGVAVYVELDRRAGPSR